MVPVSTPALRRLAGASTTCAAQATACLCRPVKNRVRNLHRTAILYQESRGLTDMGPFAHAD